MTQQDRQFVARAVVAVVAKLGKQMKVEMGALGENLRAEMRLMASGLRGEMREMGNELRDEMKAMGAGLRGEMREMEGRLNNKIESEIEKLAETTQGEFLLVNAKLDELTKVVAVHHYDIDRLKARAGLE